MSTDGNRSIFFILYCVENSSEKFRNSTETREIPTAIVRESLQLVVLLLGLRHLRR